jgi:hypothetical protein
MPFTKVDPALDTKNDAFEPKDDLDKSIQALCMYPTQLGNGVDCHG